MRVVQVIYSFDIGGSEMVGRNLALGMSREGEECAVWGMEGGGVLERELQDAGVETSVIARKPKEYLGPIWRIASLIRRLKPDVVHTHHLHNLVYTAFPARLAGIPLIHTEHETDSLKSSGAKGKLRGLARLCHAVTGVGQEVSEFLCDQVGIPSGKVHTIPNGIDLERFQYSGRAFFEESERGPVTLGSVARLTPLKDHATLFRAFALLRENYPQANLVLVGDGELRSDLEDLCDELALRDNVRFVGERRDISKLLKEMDIFVLSSKSEGLPVAMLEAMAVGPIVVATRVGSIPELIRHGETGFLVDPGDPEALAVTLKKIVLGKKELAPVSAAARNLVRERYDFENTLRSYMSLYRRALAQPPESD